MRLLIIPRKTAKNKHIQVVCRNAKDKRVLSSSPSFITVTRPVPIRSALARSSEQPHLLETVRAPISKMCVLYYVGIPQHTVLETDHERHNSLRSVSSVPSQEQTGMEQIRDYIETPTLACLEEWCNFAWQRKFAFHYTKRLSTLASLILLLCIKREVRC